MFYVPINYRHQKPIHDAPAENGDYIIEIPPMEFGDEKYASLKVVGRQLHDDEGLFFGNIELVDLKVLCKKGEPYYYGLPSPKKYEYWLSLQLFDVNKDWQTLDLHGTSIYFLLYEILPLLNLALKDGCLISQLDFDWLEWQCNAWDFGEANGQGRGFLFYENDVNGLESLYKYLKSFKIKAVKHSLPGRGDGRYWTEVCVSFRYIDKYISKLISDALGEKFIISEDITKVVNYKLIFDKVQRDGYCPFSHTILSENEAEMYREQIEMQLMIHVLRAFDLTELKKNRLIK